MLIPEEYYTRKEVSNSDLSRLKSELNPRENIADPTAAYRFGNLLDIVITEPEKADFFNRIIGTEKFTAKEWKLAEKMKNAFLRDEYCFNLIKDRRNSLFQYVEVKDRTFNFKGFEFTLPCRCKFDIISKPIKISADIKTTDAKTHNEFLSAIEYFDYDRQSAWYMDLGETDHHVIIGISKKNNKVFKVFINRKSSLYLQGKNKYTYLAFKHWLIHG